MSPLVKSAVAVLAVSAMLGLAQANGAVVFSENFQTYEDADTLNSASPGDNINGWTASSSITFDRAFDPVLTVSTGAGTLDGPGYLADIGGDIMYYPYPFASETGLDWLASQANLPGGPYTSGPVKLSFEIDPHRTPEMGVMLRDPVSDTQVYGINDYAGADLGVDSASQAWVADYGVAAPGGDGNHDRFIIELNMDLTANTVSMTVKSKTNPIGFSPDPVTTGTFAIPSNFNPSQIVLFGRVFGGAGPSALDNIVVDAVPEPASLSLVALGALSLRRRR